MCTYVHVLYCVLFYWYLLCSRKANFYVTHRQKRFRILYYFSALKIQMSHYTYTCIEDTSLYAITERGEIEVKVSDTIGRQGSR